MSWIDIEFETLDLGDHRLCNKALRKYDPIVHEHVEFKETKKMYCQIFCRS